MIVRNSDNLRLRLLPNDCRCVVDLTGVKSLDVGMDITILKDVLPECLSTVITLHVHNIEHVLDTLHKLQHLEELVFKAKTIATARKIESKLNAHIALIKVQYGDRPFVTRPNAQTAFPCGFLE